MARPGEYRITRKMSGIPLDPPLHKPIHHHAMQLCHTEATFHCRFALVHNLASLNNPSPPPSQSQFPYLTPGLNGKLSSTPLPAFVGRLDPDQRW